jgi:hypothetical protein
MCCYRLLSTVIIPRKEQKKQQVISHAHRLLQEVCEGSDEALLLLSSKVANKPLNLQQQQQQRL